MVDIHFNIPKGTLPFKRKDTEMSLYKYTLWFPIKAGKYVPKHHILKENFLKGGTSKTYLT